MKNKKICFISCVNDDVLYEESLRYIYALNVPEEIEVETLAIRGATSIASGYQQAMQQSDAKYKVYVHQDVFIINKDFIVDTILIFKENADLGLYGVVGAQRMPLNGIWWEARQKWGMVYESHTGKMELLSFQEVQQPYEAVSVLDGLIMVTQYDVSWKEDVFNGWHFYDASQCMEFIQAGFQVGVVRQKEPWCMHDCGLVNVRNGYDHFRKMFLNEYNIGRVVNGHLFNKFGKNSRLDSSADLFCTEGISIGNNVLIQKDCWLMLPYNNFIDEARIIIEDGCDIGRRVNISAVNKIVIEKNVIIAPNVHITDHNHEYQNIGIPILRQGVSSFVDQIVIGEGSWLGINSIVVGNVKIGKGCVVASNSTVIHDVPDYCVVAGNPAKIIKIYNPESGTWERVKDKERENQILQKRFDLGPLLSICIPTYNRAEDLKNCLESIFSQIGNDNNFEVVVCNNDSSDHTHEIALSFAARYKTMRYFKNDNNIGASKNFIRVLDESKGKFALLHGDDDFFISGTLYDILNLVNKNRNCGMIFLNLLSNDLPPKIFSGVDKYLEENSIYATFISSLIFNKTDYLKIENREKFNDSNLNQVYLQYSLLEINPIFCVRYGQCFKQAGNLTGGYNYAEVFIKQYLGILEYFKDRGLTNSLIAVEKKRILDTTIYWWYGEIINNNLLQFEPDAFEKIIEESYAHEPYYEEIIFKLQSLRKQ
jgi:acetyltransferase-like isoleucine patch superfamily enzyme/glycosyltransferase involved in cell wall biosynthesis